MSKKDKDKRKKSEAGRDSAWVGDIRSSRHGSAAEAPAPAPAGASIAPATIATPFMGVPAELAATQYPETADHGPSTRRSSPVPPPYGGNIEITIPRHKPFDEMGLPRTLRGDEIGEETQGDIAPIEPTEYARLLRPSTFPESGRPDSDPLGASVATSRGASAGTAANREGVGGPPSVVHLEQQIRDLESRLDEMIVQNRDRAPATGNAGLAFRTGARTTLRAPTHEAEAPAEDSRAGASSRNENENGNETQTGGNTAREVLSSDFYLRRWGRASMRKRAEEVDEYGLDPAYEARYQPLFDFLYKHYFRVDTEGTANIPDGGRCLVVANHSGGPLPYDGVMLRTTVRREHATQRELRWLAEDFIYYLPFVGSMLNRLGAVRACQENAERLLAQGRLVAVFPEGAKGIGKLYRDRYRLQRFGRGGFIRLCLRTQTPIVPCAIIGAEEANPMLYRIEYMTKALGIPYLPITPTFPALGPLGLLPAPTKWKVSFGEPLRFDGYGPEAADDEILVGRLAERVRTTIQGMLDRQLASRRSIWFG